VTRAIVCAIAAALVIAPSAALGADDKPIKQKMKFTEKHGEIRVRATIAKLFDSAAYEALGSGFESTILIRIWVYAKGSSEPIAFQALQRKVIYDMWDEVYEIQLEGPGGRDKYKIKYRAEALKLLTAIDGVPIVRSDALPYDDHHHVVMVVELNPVSEETLAEVRRWLTKGSGGGLDRGGGLFGSVVSVFVNPKIAEADRVLRLRSQPFYRPRPD
jgi:hypothetical protein